MPIIPTTVGGALLEGAAITGVTGLAGGLISSNASGNAAKTAANAQIQAALLQEQQYQQTRGDLQPYNQNGQNILPAFDALPGQTQAILGTAYGNAQNSLPVPMTQSQLLQTPGYQFALDQGLKATQNSQAARGLGISGSAIKQGDAFATGLANNTYTQQLQNQNLIYNANSQQFNNAYNMQNELYNQYNGIATLGENAGAKSGAIGQAGAAVAGNNIAGGGLSLANGINGSANALTGGLNNASNSASNALTLAALTGNLGGPTQGPLGSVIGGPLAVNQIQNG